MREEGRSFREGRKREGLEGEKKVFSRRERLLSGRALSDEKRGVKRAKERKEKVTVGSQGGKGRELRGKERSSQGASSFRFIDSYLLLQTSDFLRCFSRTRFRLRSLQICNFHSMQI